MSEPTTKELQLEIEGLRAQVNALKSVVEGQQQKIDTITLDLSKFVTAEELRDAIEKAFREHLQPSLRCF